MMDIFKQFATDVTSENEGTWVPFGAAQFLVARNGNKKYIEVLGRLVDQNQQLLDAKDEAADALSNDIMTTVMAQSILLGWRTKKDGVFVDAVSFKGEVLPYSTEAAKRALGIKDFRILINKMADDINHFRFKEEEGQAKN